MLYLFHHFTFILFVSLNLNCISCIQNIILFFLIQPDSLCLHNAVYNPLVYVTIDRDEFISDTLLFAFCTSHFFCFIVLSLLFFTLIIFLCDILVKLFYYIFWIISFVVALILTIYTLTYEN